MVNTVWVNVNQGHDLHPFTDHMTKLRNFTKKEICEFSAFSLHLMFDQTLSNLNLIVCLMISQKLHTKVAQTS